MPSCSHKCTTSASAAFNRLRVWHDMKPSCSHACTTSASAALHRLHVWHEAVIYAACWYDCTHVYLYVSSQCHSAHDHGTRLLRCVCFCGERYVILADGGMIRAKTLQYMPAAETSATFLHVVLCVWAVAAGVYVPGITVYKICAKCMCMSLG